MNNQIEKIVIVGGGTAGWLSAAMLARTLMNQRNTRIDITLIESDMIGTIGVGEATVVTLRETLSHLGIGERAFLNSTDATFKHGIKFKNWRYDARRAPDHFYYHPFDRPPGSTAPIWVALTEHAHDLSFAKVSTPQTVLMDHARAAKLANSQDYQGPFAYAYHLDANKLAVLLRNYAKRCGVRHVVDRVSDVVVTEKGYIDCVKTEESGVYVADFFIDCTGFKGLLINGALKQPFDDYTDSLLCDRAVTVQTPLPDDGKRINSCTTATALKAGWVWSIDLQSRRGNGYVYSSRHTSDDEAEAELRNFVSDLDGQKQVNFIKMRVGCNRQSWAGNCVAIGLASGFVEPLESTGIYLIEIALRLLIDNFPSKTFERPLIDNFNQRIRSLYEEIRDFIVLHYCLSERRDSEFWIENTDRKNLPDSLASRLEIWEARAPIPSDIDTRFSCFESFSWSCILAGMGKLSRRPDPAYSAITQEMMDHHLAQMRTIRARVLNDFEDQVAYFAKLSRQPQSL